MIPASRQRNYLQSAVYVVIAGVLAAVLLERLLTYAEAAEKAAMEATLSQLQSGLNTRAAYLVLRGDHNAITTLRAQPPFQAADMKAPNYLGEFDRAPANARGGHWYFDRKRGELVYVPNLSRYLKVRSGGHAADGLRFRLEEKTSPRSGFAGASLVPVTAFDWVALP